MLLFYISIYCSVMLICTLNGESNAASTSTTPTAVDQSTDSWEDVHIICPNQCVCQRSPYMDLSIARWIQGLKGDRTLGAEPSAATGPSTFGVHEKSKDAQTKNDAENEKSKGENENETFFENDNSHLENVFTKFIMCMLQGNGNIKDLITLLPQDVQALVLLHNGDSNSNFTITTSDLLPFSALTTLEIRGTGEHRTLNLLTDEPLVQLKHVNFEAIHLVGDEKSMRKQIFGQHPSEVFDYIPESERYSYNVSLQAQDEIEIVPYDVYKMELHKSKQPRFYGWKNLHVMRIHNCHLDEVYWEMFNGLENLHHLSLERNEIKIIPPFAFYGALHIKTLTLARNNLLDLNYRSLAGLLDLEQLDLSHNNLTKLSEISFPPFPKLQMVDFRHNPIQFVFPMSFGVMNATKKLVLGSDTGALEMTIGSSPFTPLEQLTELILLNFTAPVLSQEMFKGLKNLERLHIRGSINRIEFDAFAEMPQTRELNMSGCGIVELSMDTFIGIRNLQVIDLSNNKLFYMPPGIFDEQKQLREIYLHQNQLSILPQHFFDRSSLKLVSLTENPWICSCEMSTWKQAVTNRRRLKPLTKSKSNCYINPKTGKMENCQVRNTDNDDFPQWTYEFDNKLSPRCDGGPEEVKHQSVYYFLRRNVKCASKTKNSTRSSNVHEKKYVPAHDLEKQRLDKKYTATMEKSHLMNKHFRDQKITKHHQQSQVSEMRSLLPSPQTHHADLKQMRRQAFDTKVRRTLGQNVKKQKLHQQPVSNKIDLNAT